MATKRDQIEDHNSHVCVNPSCNCVVPAGTSYCDDLCRQAELKPHSEYLSPEDIEPGLGCRCGHDGCQL
jgi:hypothetical protein